MDVICSLIEGRETNERHSIHLFPYFTRLLVSVTDPDGLTERYTNNSPS